MAEPANQGPPKGARNDLAETAPVVVKPVGRVADLYPRGLVLGGKYRIELTLELCERPVVDAVAYLRAVDFALDEPSFFELLEVLRNGRLRERQLFDNIAAHAVLFFGK